MLYLNADDFGLSPKVNEAIDKCFSLELIYRASVMVNMDYAEDAMKLARKNKYINRIGLHINLTAGTPLTEEIKSTIFCNEEGEFCKKVLEPLNLLRPLDHNTKSAVDKEILAQCNKFREIGGLLGHIDSHHHVHTNYNIHRLVLKRIVSEKFSSIRVMHNAPANSNLLKRLYIDMINSAFIRVNEHDKLEGILYFADIKDTDCIITEEYSDKEIEVMLHPIIQNGLLIDAMNQIDLVEWKNKYQKYIKI